MHPKLKTHPPIHRIRSLRFAVLALATLLAAPLKAATVEDLIYEVIEGTITITDCENDAVGDLVIPQSIGGIPVTVIGYRAFASCSDLTSVTMHPGIKTIGDGGFAYCYKLTRIHFPEGLISIGSYAFDGCYELREITVPLSVEAIGANAFSGSSLRKATLLGGGRIGESAFYRTSLEEVVLGPGVKEIMRYAFDQCNFASITFPESLTRIGHYAFSDTPLKRIVFLGDAPDIGTGLPFGSDPLPKCLILYTPGKKGFTYPTWAGVKIDSIDARILVKEGGKELDDQFSTMHFPSRKVRSSGGWKTIKISNPGNYEMTVFAIRINGRNPNDFVVSEFPKTTVAPGKSTYLKIRFKPSGKGLRKAKLHIKHNATDHYGSGDQTVDIKLSGSGK